MIVIPCKCPRTFWSDILPKTLNREHSRQQVGLSGSRVAVHSRHSTMRSKHMGHAVPSTWGMRSPAHGATRSKHMGPCGPQHMGHAVPSTWGHAVQAHGAMRSPAHGPCGPSTWDQGRMTLVDQFCSSFCNCSSLFHPKQGSVNLKV